MPSQGDIVRVTIHDPNGKNPKNRRVVILTKSDEIEPDGDIVVAAISTKFDPNNLPPEYVSVPWSNGGHPRTTLEEPSVVKCDWLDIVAVADVTTSGHLPGKYLYRVLVVIANLQRLDAS